MGEVRAVGRTAERIRRRDRLDPFLPLWRLLTSVRFAVVLIAFLVLAGALGVLTPQVPIAIRGDRAAVEEWLRLQEGRFGPSTDAIYRLGLFNVFGTLWFRAGLALLAVSVAVCVANRFPPIWRTIRRPQRRVAEGYLRRARHRAEFTTPADGAALERVLRAHRYTVERFEDGGAVMLFANRFQWAQLGTFATHLALIIFIVAGLVTILTGFEAQLFIAKGGSAPVFPVHGSGQMQVYLDDTIGTFDRQGRPLDYRSFLTIYQGDREAKRCVTTVNDPCTFSGYRFAQAAFFGFGARLQVHDETSGRLLYDEVIDLSDQTPAPHLVVHDAAGRLVLDETLVLTSVLGGTYLTRLTVPGADRSVVVGARRDAERRQWTVVVFPNRDAGDAPSARITLAPGEEAAVGDLRVRFAALAALPAAVRRDVPVPATVAARDAALGGPLLLQMSNAIFGSSEASSGRAIAVPAGDGPPTLSISGLNTGAVLLTPGQSTTVEGYRYTFAGQLPFAGIQVKRDHGATFMWVAVALLVGGLAITFHVPRRRLWATITPERTMMAGIAGPQVNFSRELRRLGAEAGAPDALADDEGDEP